MIGVLAAVGSGFAVKSPGNADAADAITLDAVEVDQLLERAKRGDPAAEYELYRLYSRGMNVPDNPGDAHQLLQRSAEHGHADAQYDLASALHEGAGIVQDFAGALKWMQASAKNGSWRAHYRLGVMYREGIGTPPDLVKAYTHLNVAAARGIPEAATLRNSVMGQLSPDQLLAAQADAKALVEARQ